MHKLHSLSVYAGITGSLSGSATTALTASYAATASVATSSSYALSASYAPGGSGLTGGTANYIPVWTSATAQSSSIIYQSSSQNIIIGIPQTQHPEAPPLLEVNMSSSTNPNIAHFHGNIDSTLDLAFKNYSSGPSASAEFKLVTDAGTPASGYLGIGVNSSNYALPNRVGTAGDAFIRASGSNDLLIGNAAPDKKIILFTGGENAIDNARVYIDSSGSVGINVNTPTIGNPEALLVQAITDSYNLITAKANIDSYSQINIINLNGGSSASSDIVATANNGSETSNYIDMGINSDQYGLTNVVGGPNDAYLYSTGNDLHIGNASSGRNLQFFIGGLDSEATTKLTLRDTNIHTLSGSLVVVGSVTASVFGTASWAQNAISSSAATTASYVIPTGLPTGTVSSSVQINTGSFSGSFIGTLTGTSSWANNSISSSFATTALTASYFDGFVNFPNGLVVTGSLNVSGSITGSLLGTSSWAQNAISSSYALTASYVSGAAASTVSSSYALTSSYAVVAENVLGSVTSASYAATASVLLGSVVSASFATSALTASYVSGGVTFPEGLDITGSLTVTGSVNVTGSLQVTQGFTGSLFGTSSWAVSASWAPGGAGTVTSITAGDGLNGGTITSTGTIALDTSSVHFLDGVKKELNTEGVISSSTQFTSLTSPFTGSFTGSLAGSLTGTASWAQNAISASFAPPTFIDNFVTVGLLGSDTTYNSIKTAVDSITDATATNTYTVKVYPGVYIEDTITLKPYIAVKGESSTSTIVSASNPANSIFIMADQTMVIDMQIQGSTATTASAIVYSSPTTPQTNAIAYVENVRFGTNYTNAKVVGSGSSGNCILQCSNVKYGGFTSGSKSFDVGFYVTSGSDGGIGRMQLRNVTSTNGGVAGTDNDQIFALADAPGCTVIVNGCLLTRATGTARGTGFKVYNGGQLRLTGVNFQRWIRGIWAPLTGSAPSIDAIALNFENCTTDVAIEHTGSLGKVQGTDNFLKTQIALDAPLYEVGQDPRKISVAKKGGDFSSISASVAWITDSAESNRYVIEVGPGQYTENIIDLTGKPYVSIVGSNIQTTQIFPSQSNHPIIKMGINNEISFLTLANAGAGQAAIYVDDVGDFAQAHKISIYDSDIGVYVNASTTDTQFYGEYIDINGTFTYGAYVSSSTGITAQCNLENYYLFPSASAAIGNYVVGPSSSLSLYTAKFQGDGTAGSTAVKLENGSQLEGAAIDIQNADYGYVVPAGGVGPNFRIVGAMIHDSATYDFDIQNATTRGRYQGVSDHTKINNNSQDFYWNFLDDTDGENDVTRKLSVTFADGTHTDATTLIFKGSPMGVMEGGVITTGSGFIVTASSGFGYLQDAITTDVYKRLDWTNGTLTLTANSNNYIFLDDAGVLQAGASAPDNQTHIILGRVVTNNTTTEFIDQTPYNGEHMSNKLSTFNREALGPVYAVGSIVSQNATPFKLDVTAGTYFFSENKFTPTGTSSINLTQYYPSASTWERYTSSIVPNNQYVSASVLAPMSSSYYTKHTVYLVGEGVDEKYFLVLNSNQYATLVQAENANLPSIPTYFNDGVVSLAAVYVQSGSANITQIQDIRPTIGFRAAGVNASSVHGNLLGLGADDHPQYLLTDGGRTLTGNMNLGGFNITNVETVTATSITGSLFGTSSWATNAISSSFATTASYALNAASAGLKTKAGSITNTAFSGNPRKAAVNFSSPFANTSYAIVITGEDARSWTYEGKVVGGFTASANSNTALAGTTTWIATAYGET